MTSKLRAAFVALAARAAPAVAGLFRDAKHVPDLSPEEADDLVARPGIATFVLGYASWCGHCQSYAQTFDADCGKAAEVLGPENAKLVSCGAVDCARFGPWCEGNKLMTYPTLLEYAPLLGGQHTGPVAIATDHLVDTLTKAAEAASKIPTVSAFASVPASVAEAKDGAVAPDGVVEKSTSVRDTAGDARKGGDGTQETAAPSTAAIFRHRIPPLMPVLPYREGLRVAAFSLQQGLRVLPEVPSLEDRKWSEVSAWLRELARFLSYESVQTRILNEAKVYEFDASVPADPFFLIENAESSRATMLAQAVSAIQRSQLAASRLTATYAKKKSDETAWRTPENEAQAEADKSDFALNVSKFIRAVVGSSPDRLPMFKPRGNCTNYTCSLWLLLHSMAQATTLREDERHAGSLSSNRGASAAAGTPSTAAASLPAIRRDFYEGLRGFASALFLCGACSRHFKAMFDTCALRRCEIGTSASEWVFAAHNRVNVRVKAEEDARTAGIDEDVLERLLLQGRSALSVSEAGKLKLVVVSITSSLFPSHAACENCWNDHLDARPVARVKYGNAFDAIAGQTAQERMFSRGHINVMLRARYSPRSLASPPFQRDARVQAMFGMAVVMAAVAAVYVARRRRAASAGGSAKAGVAE